LSYNEEGYCIIHFQVSEVLASQGRETTPSRVIASFSLSIMKVGGDICGVHNRIAYSSKET
jgi:hypothetical protein